jgi:serine/threonine protein kinase
VDSVAELGSTANSYQVLAKLATGGMAEIFLARSAGVGSVQRYVVLKRVLRERAGDVHFMRMFLDEARLAAQLQHANIAQVFDVGKLGDSYFFTMEYVHGETVRAVLQHAHRMRRSPPIGCVLAIAAGAAAGLHHAHERIGIKGVPLGIVHRDVSPSNLMLGYDGGVKLVDFGVAKATDRVQETQSGAVKGKISYLSPEQARGAKLDRRSDLFSLGIVMWELLTVERLFKADSDFATMKAIIQKRTPPPSSRRRDVPPELDQLVLRALAKSPDDRFQTAEELGEAIEQVAVQTSSPLSAAGVSRFLRELFGTRPEPWIALQAAEDRPSMITVTSEPIPAEIQVPINDPVDRRLAAVVDLSAAAGPELPEIEPVTASLPLPDMLAEMPLAPASQVAHGRAWTESPPPRAAAVPAGTEPPQATGAPAWTEPPPWRRLPIVLGVLTLALVIAIAIVVAFPAADLAPVAAREPHRPAPALPDDPGATAAGDPVRPPAAEPALREAPGQVDPAPAIATAPVPAAPVVTEIAPDEALAPTAPAPDDLPVLVPEALIDAGIAGPPPDAGAVEVKPPPRRTRPRPARPRPDLIQQFEAAHYTDVVAECVANSAAAAVPCTLAACHVGDAAKARKWLARVPAGNRARVVEACAATGTAVEDVKPKKDCQADPMACPR